ncbi:DegV family protein [Nonomuraea sp. KM90]|uniref:DegV family protein n=1 Tax=Nonomuraea sp. KM90 TaxID=3457428 RepID=UPI003FCD50AA
MSFDEGSFTGDFASATTSRPSPTRFAACYSDLAAAGATAIVSIHVSGELSGTIESARAAARDAPVPVEVIDSRSIAMGLGYPVLAAARTAASGASLEAVTAAARRCMEATRTFFYVDTLDYLRRSGRIGAAASLVGSALMIKPLLHVVDGRISLLEKVRTAARAIARLEDLAVRAAGDGPVEVAVQHLGARERAEALAERLPKRISGLVDLRVVEVGAVIGVHVGPGMLGLTVTSCDH